MQSPYQGKIWPWLLDMALYTQVVWCLKVLNFWSETCFGDPDVLSLPCPHFFPSVPLLFQPSSLCHTYSESLDSLPRGRYSSMFSLIGKIILAIIIDNNERVLYFTL